MQVVECQVGRVQEANEEIAVEEVVVSEGQVEGGEKSDDVVEFLPFAARAFLPFVVEESFLDLVDVVSPVVVEAVGRRRVCHLESVAESQLIAEKKNSKNDKSSSAQLFYTHDPRDYEFVLGMNLHIAWQLSTFPGCVK